MEKEELPWHLGVFDAHCHPTDTMESTKSIPGMLTRCLTIMATRVEDQDLVCKVADDFGLDAQRPVTGQLEDRDCRVIPCFGWHPWFSHQLFDEAEYADELVCKDEFRTLGDAQKVAHYQSVLTPRSEDVEFLLQLPDPRPFAHFLSQTRAKLYKHPFALIGEIGLDKAFRIPAAAPADQTSQRDDSLTPGGREGRTLSPYRVSIEHQKKLVRAQLKLAGEMGRAVSVHGVQVHGLLFDFLAGLWKGHELEIPSKKVRGRRQAAQRDNSDGGTPKTGEVEPKPYPPRICLHSFSGPVEAARQYLDPKIPTEIFFSFSEVITFDKPSSSSRAEAVIKMLPEHCILVESDLHTAGERMDKCMENVVRRICGIRGWPLEEGVRLLGRNWKRFVFGDHIT